MTFVCSIGRNVLVFMLLSWIIGCGAPCIEPESAVLGASATLTWEGVGLDNDHKFETLTFVLNGARLEISEDRFASLFYAVGKLPPGSTIKVFPAREVLNFQPAVGSQRLSFVPEPETVPFRINRKALKRWKNVILSNHVHVEYFSKAPGKGEVGFSEAYLDSLLPKSLED